MLDRVGGLDAEADRGNQIGCLAAGVGPVLLSPP